MDIHTKQFECTPSIEMFYNKGKICYRSEFDLSEGKYKLNLLNNKNTSGQIGFEFISEDNKSKKQILDFYYTNSVVNLNVSQKGKLIVRFISDISLDKNEIIETMYCVPSDLHEKYYSRLQQQTSTYFATF